MAIHYVVAEYDSMEFARIALEVLAKQNLTEENVSLVTRVDHPSLREMTQHTRDDPEMSIQPEVEEDEETSGVAASRAAAGAGVGAAVIAGLAIPLSALTMITPFIVAGPIAAGLLGAAGGGMIGLGVSGDDDKTRDYKQKVEDGAILVMVRGPEFMVYEAESGLKTTRYVAVERFSLDEDA